MVDLNTVEMMLVLVGTMLLLLASGLWVGVALIGVGIVGMLLFSTRPPGDAMATTIWGSLTGWTLLPLPMFIWMGELLFRAKVAESLFKALAPWLDPIPGRLLQVNVAGCTVFAAISGSSAATCATIGKITVPELRKRKYPDRMIVGSLIGSGTLGLLIPPSIIMIVYGVATDVSISKLFIAGILPGLMLATMFMGYVAVWALLNPEKVPARAIVTSFLQKVAETRNLFFPVLLIAGVMGSIYGGLATATQAAALGVLGALIVSWLQGGLNRKTFVDSVMGATRTTCMIMLILAGSSFLTLSMGFTGIPRELAAWVGELGLSQGMLLICLTVLYVLLGCFLDGISMIVLTMAVLLPVLQLAGFDLLWFGIYIVIVVEMAQITPPVGFNLFVVQGLTGHSIGFISRAALPAFLLMVLAVVLIYLFPELVTWLPSRMIER